MQTIKIKDIITFLQSVAPESLQESYDNAGLIIGNKDNDVKGIVVCLDSTEEIIDEAIDKGCNLVIAHHPIIFSGLKKINGTNYIEKTIIKAIKNDIAVYAIHTNLDNVFYNGVNRQIAQKLTLTNCSILQPKIGLQYNENAVGAGMIGYLPSQMQPIEFFDFIKNNLQLTICKHTAICKNQIQKVALCGGSGYFLLHKAKTENADVYITSDIKYHEFFDADNQIILMDIGHFESEKFTIDLLYTLITEEFTTFATHYTKVITNPIQYY